MDVFIGKFILDPLSCVHFEGKSRVLVQCSR